MCTWCIENAYTNFKTESFPSKQKFHINICPEMSFLSLIYIYLSKINLLFIWNCSNKWHNKLTLHDPDLITIELLLFVEWHFTSDVQNGSICINSRMDTSNRGLSHRFKGAWEVANGLTGIENVIVKWLFILNWTWIHLGYKVTPQTKI